MGVDGVGGWRKSSYSDNGEDCVEVGMSGEIVAVRDSKRTGGGSPVLRFSRSGWARFVTGIKNSQAAREQRSR